MIEKEKEFQRIFTSHIVKIEYLKKISYGGIPKKYRAICWRILLGTQGLNIKNIQKSIENKNDKYLRRILKLSNIISDKSRKSYENKHYVLTKDKEDGSIITCRDLENKHIFLQTKNVFEDQGVLKIDEKHRNQIDIDIKRLPPSHKAFLNIDISFLFKNILSIFAIRRPAIGYVQGMADILVLFVQLFCSENLVTAESSAFYTFSKFIDMVQTNFIDNQPGIYKSLLDLRKTIRMSDRDLFDKLEGVCIRPHMYAFRWLNCFLVREFTLDNSYLIFDSIFSYECPNKFTVLFSTSLLIFNREAVLTGNFEEILVFLQDIPNLEISGYDMEMLFRLTIFLEKYLDDK